MKRLFLKSFLNVCAFIFLGAYVSLSQDFEVAPVKLNFAIEPGGIESKTVTLRNHSNKSQAFSLTLGDLRRNEHGQKKNLPAGSTKRSCANWITINPSFLELKPNEAKDIEVMMQVPPNGYSSRWAMIYVKATKEQSSMSVDKIVATGITVSPRISIYVYQSPKSNTKFKAIITNLHETTTDKDTLRTFEATVDNIGDKMLDGKVYLIASNLETAKEQKFEPIRVSVLPDASRIIKLILPTKLSPGSYSLAAILDYGHRTNLEAVQLQIKVE